MATVRVASKRGSRPQSENVGFRPGSAAPIDIIARGSFMRLLPPMDQIDWWRRGACICLFVVCQGIWPSFPTCLTLVKINSASSQSR